MAAPLWESLIRLWGGIASGGAFRRTAMLLPPPDPLVDKTATRMTYRALWQMYENNALYDQLAELLAREGLWRESMKPLRNPANRIVEFHASKLWPGADLAEALPIEGASTVVEKAIRQTWTWSNFADQKQAYARWFASYGDLFIKVTGRLDPEPRVYFQKLEPETCTVVRQDERGYLTHIRIDTPHREEQEDGSLRDFWITEIWDKPAGLVRIWEHQKGPDATERDMGRPRQAFGLLEAFGIDFIPIVQGQFKNVGRDRGHGSFSHAFDKIHEANRVATRLHSMAFRHSNVTMAFTAGGLDANMRPLPAPDIEGERASDTLQDGTTIIGEDRVLKLPGQADVKFLVPNLPYSQLLDMLNAHMNEIEDDCPEMAYYRLRELGSQLSGRAVRILLSDAIDRGVEARGNGEQAIIRLNQMALTIGQQIGAFPGLVGTFEDGSWDHTFTKRQFLPIDDLEEAQTEQAKVTAKIGKLQLGIPKETVQAELGYDEQEITAMADAKAKEEQESLDPAMQQFDAGNVGSNRPAVGAGQGGGRQNSE